VTSRRELHFLEKTPALKNKRSLHCYCFGTSTVQHPQPPRAQTTVKPKGLPIHTHGSATDHSRNCPVVPLVGVIKVSRLSGATTVPLCSPRGPNFTRTFYQNRRFPFRDLDAKSPCRTF